MTVIFGKDTCPYTQAARDDYERRGVPFQYRNVKTDPRALADMLVHSRGTRLVPVIVDEGGAVAIGFGGT